MLSGSRVANISTRAIAAQLRARLRPRPQLCTLRANLSTSAPLRTAAGGGDRLPDHTLPPYGPVGTARALQASPPASPEPTLFTREFSLADRVALVSGAHRGMGLEMALALVEARARAVYCVDLPAAPDAAWARVREYAERAFGGRLEYVCADVRDQEGMWKIGRMIGDREGRMDACVTAAGIFPQREPCLTHSAEHFQTVLDVNLNGALFTAQAAGQQMERFGRGGSITMIASVGAHGSDRGRSAMSYNASKSAVLQLARSMACELGTKGIRVNSISPAAIRTSMLGQAIPPEVERALAADHPLGRIGRPDELRGIAVWLASDASSFCTGSDFFVTGGFQAW